MAITGAPQVQVGGAYTSGPAEGDYHIIVGDAAQITANKTQRAGVSLTLNVHDDPNHAAKNGKKLTTMRVYFAIDSDDEDKRKMMNGIVKRSLYDGFGIKWPDQPKGFDARQFVGKQAWVRLAKKLNKETGEERTEVVLVGQDVSKFPTPKGIEATSAKAAGTRTRR